MNTETILRLLKNAGFNVLGFDGAYIHLEDPSCILRSFETFIEYAWIAITFIAGILLFGWAVSMIRGSKNDIFINLRNLVIIFGTLSAARPVVNLVWGDDLFARGCKTINVSMAEVQRILDAQKKTLTSRNTDDLYEEFDIYDSGAIGTSEMPNEIPYSDSSLYSSGSPQRVSVTISGGGDYSTGAFSSSSNSFSSAHESGNDVIYTDKNGLSYKRTGGSRAWRNNNPGNIVYSKFARDNGAIGKGGRFAVFPDETSGMSAIIALLQSKNYINLTVGNAISRWAPPHENDTASYKKRLEQLTGISTDTPMRDLNTEQLQRVANAIRVIEGWKPGRAIKL